MHTGLWFESQKERDHCEYNNIKNYLREIGWGGME
jgi:hypothetical protein